MFAKLHWKSYKAKFLCTIRSAKNLKGAASFFSCNFVPLLLKHYSFKKNFGLGLEKSLRGPLHYVSPRNYS